MCYLQYSYSTACVTCNTLTILHVLLAILLQYCMCYLQYSYNTACVTCNTVLVLVYIASRCDQNHDGTIDYTEFTKYLTGTHTYMCECISYTCIWLIQHVSHLPSQHTRRPTARGQSLWAHSLLPTPEAAADRQRWEHALVASTEHYAIMLFCALISLSCECAGHEQPSGDGTWTQHSLQTLNK